MRKSVRASEPARENTLWSAVRRTSRVRPSMHCECSDGARNAPSPRAPKQLAEPRANRWQRAPKLPRSSAKKGDKIGRRCYKTPAFPIRDTELEYPCTGVGIQRVQRKFASLRPGPATALPQADSRARLRI